MSPSDRITSKRNITAPARLVDEIGSQAANGSEKFPLPIDESDNELENVDDHSSEKDQDYTDTALDQSSSSKKRKKRGPDYEYMPRPKLIEVHAKLREERDKLEEGNKELRNKNKEVNKSLKEEQKKVMYCRSSSKQRDAKSLISKLI